MIVQLGNKEFSIGRITHTTTTNRWKFDTPGSYITYEQLTKWSQDTRYVQINRPLTTGWNTFLQSNDTITTWYSYPLFDAILSGSQITVYLVFYKVPESPTPPNRYPVGAWSVATGYLNNYNQFQFFTTGFSQSGQTLGYYNFVSPGDLGIGFYDVYEAPYGRYDGTTISTATARASISSGIWTANRSSYAANDDMEYPETSTPIDKCLYSFNSDSLFGFNADQILPPTGVELDLVDDPSSGAGGEDGTFYPYGDDINYPDLPSVSGVSLGLVTLYKPTPVELAAFAQWLYATPFDQTIIDTLQKLNTDIFSYIIAMNLLPINTVAIDAATFKMGPVDSQIATNKVLTQYVATPEYTKNIDEYYGGFQDYSPQTKVMLYLPFIGFKELSTDDVMAGSIGIKYHIDLLTGDLVCFVKLYGKYTKSVIYEFSGNCSSQVPLNGRDYSNIVRGAVQGVMQSTQSLLGGNIGNAANQLVNTIVDVAISKPTVQRSGAIVSNAGFLSGYVPYLIFARPAASHPQNYEKFKGRPSNITATLGTLTGYTAVDSIINSGYSKASKSEIDAIDRLLKEGVYF